MNNNIKYYAFILFAIYFGQVAERAIPHAHIEKAGFVVPDFSGNEDKSNHDENENSEKIHNSLYQLVIDDISFTCHFSNQLFFHEDFQLKPLNQPCENNYNLLPKLLNGILFIIHTSSSKSPPFYS